MRWEQKFLEKLTDEILADWHRWKRKHPKGENMPVLNIIKDEDLSTKKDLQLLKILIKKGYINLKCIQFPISLS
jgi:hypothetical protein